ncbi:hypothetical protein GF345_01610 [Candidatus Woesearchaeota archaeon]|nr:hypothetical protein [Candidatus Woesearchaeota archaeon]
MAGTDAERSISIDLVYNPGTQWDSNNDGLEVADGVIDFTVEGTSFSWDAEESKLCTKWVVYSFDNDSSTRACFGSADCCALMDLSPASLNWDDPLELYIGRFGAGIMNNVTSQVLYADYSLDAENPFSELYHSDYSSLMADFSLVPKIDFDRNIICENCSGKSIPPLTNFVMLVTAVANTHLDGTFADYFPSSFSLLDSGGGSAVINDNVSSIEWDVSGTSFSRNYTLISPEQGNYSFYSVLGDDTGNSLMVSVGSADEPECMIGDVRFIEDDVDVNGNLATLEKDGLRITFNGIDSEMRDFPELKEGVLSVPSSIIVDNATVMIPHCGVSPVMTKPRLYIREDGGKFAEAEPYCLNKTIERKSNVTLKGVCDKENDPLCLNVNDSIMEVVEDETVVDREHCFNDIKITSTGYEFSVEHFTDYYVGEGQDFSDCLTCCLEWVNGTSDSCVINAPGSYSIDDAVDEDITVDIIGEERSEDAILIDANPDSNYGGNGHFIHTGFDYHETVPRILREVFRLSDNVFDNDVLRNGTISGADIYFDIYQEYMTNNRTLRLYRIADSNDWLESEVTWNDTQDSIDWAGEDGCNVSGTDYVAWQAGDPYINITSSDSGWKNSSFPPGWIIEWQNGSVDNNGFLMKMDGDDSETVDNFIMFYSTEMANAPYISVDITGLDLEAREEYSFTGDAIVINSGDVVLDCNNVRLAGDGDEDDEGIYYRRHGGNITVRNCDVLGFESNYHFDFWSDTDQNLTIEDSLSSDGAGVDYFGYVRVIMSNFTAINSKGLYLSQDDSDHGLFEDVSLINCSAGIGDGYCMYIEYADNNIFRRFNVTTSLNSSLLGAVKITSSAEGNTFEDSYIRANELTGLYADSYNNLIMNTTVEDSKVCMQINTATVSVANNTLMNCTLQALDYSSGAVGNAGINISDNIILNSGNGTRITSFMASNSTYSYEGVDFDGYYPAMYSSDFGTSVTIDSADKDVGSIADGSNDFSLWLIDLPDAGVRNWTMYVEQPESDTCANVAASYSGTCYNDTDDYLQSNGASMNYTVLDVSSDMSIISDTQDPAYLRFSNYSLQAHYPIEVSVSNNWANITGNTVLVDDRDNYYSMKISGSEGYGGYRTSLWLNNFYSSLPVNVSGETYFCFNGIGNYYWENLSVPAGDCGKVNFTIPVENEEYGGLLNVTWQEQNSNNLINYSLFYSNNSVDYYFINATTNLNYAWTVPGDSAGTNITLKIVPFDSLYNATNVFVSFLKGEVDVFSLSMLYNSSVYTIFEFFVRNIDTSNHSISWLFAPGSGEENISSDEAINLTAREDVMIFIERNYSSTGQYNVTAMANTSLSEDEEILGVVIS